MEIEFLRWIDRTFHSIEWLNYFMKFVTYIGEFGASVVVCAIVLLCFKKTRAAGWSMALGIVLDFLIVNVILKLSVNRARPWTEFEEIATFYEQFGIRLPTDSSFPSGHAAICFCGATALFLHFRRKALPAFFVAALVALSRVYLCVHYPTDVLAGIVIGTACGAAGYFLSARLLSLGRKKNAPEGDQPDPPEIE